MGIDEMIIRDMTEADARAIVEAELAQGWHPELAAYLKRIEDHRAGRSVALVAECAGYVAGYVNVYRDGVDGPFAGRGWPEIVDLGVLMAFRGRGIGARLMDAAEAVAAKWSDTVYLGVGLHSGYGVAQRMYVRRGYVPDGSGVWFRDTPCEPYADCVNDDELILYMVKRLREQGTGDREQE